MYNEGDTGGNFEVYKNVHSLQDFRMKHVNKLFAMNKSDIN